MLEFQEKKNFRRILYCKPTLIIFVILILFFLVSVFDVYTKYNLAKNNASKTASSYEYLLKRERELSAEIEKLKTDSGVEVEIREKYGLIKPSEEVITVINGSEPGNNNKAENPGSFWQNIINGLQ